MASTARRGLKPLADCGSSLSCFQVGMASTARRGLKQITLIADLPIASRNGLYSPSGIETYTSVQTKM